MGLSFSCASHATRFQATMRFYCTISGSPELLTRRYLHPSLRKQGILAPLLFFMTQLLLPGTPTILQLLTNRGCRWKILRQWSVQVFERIADSATNAKVRFNRLVLADNTLPTQLPIGLCNPKEVSR